MRFFVVEDHSAVGVDAIVRLAEALLDVFFIVEITHVPRATELPLSVADEHARCDLSPIRLVLNWKPRAGFAGVKARISC